MSTKKLLNESDIRRFMKLAAIKPLTENFFDRISEETVEEEIAEQEITEEDITEEDITETGIFEEEEEDALPEMEPEADEEELPAPEEGPADSQVDLSEEDAETLMAAIGDALSDVTGLDVEVVQGGGEEPAEEPDMGGDDMEDMGGDLEDALEEADITVDEEVDPMEEELSVESVVNEVTMRVAKRLLAESKKN